MNVQSSPDAFDIPAEDVVATFLVQAGGVFFLLGGILMFAYQAWSWRRRQDTKVGISTFASVAVKVWL